MDELINQIQLSYLQSLSDHFFCSCLFDWRLICRSPWSNKYEPPLEDGAVPSEAMRNLEIEANEVFSVYRDQ
jgi:hypothetical protein